jgi:hypothetical protein
MKGLSKATIHQRKKRHRSLRADHSDQLALWDDDFLSRRTEFLAKRLIAHRTLSPLVLAFPAVSVRETPPGARPRGNATVDGSLHDFKKVFRIPMRNPLSISGTNGQLIQERPCLFHRGVRVVR